MTEGRSPRPSQARARLGRAARLVLVLLLVPLAGAQPFAADGGFAAPARVAAGTLPVVAAAAGEGRTYVVTADSTGVLAYEVGTGEGEPVRLADSPTVRGVWAAVSGGELAVAWVERDRTAGRTRHWLSYRGENHPLFTHTQETPLQVGAGADGPWVVANLREDGEARLTLFTWEGGAPARTGVVHATDLSVRGVFALDDPDPGAPGPAWVAWLEGQTEMTPVGLSSEWHAYAMPATGAARPVDLGLADVIDERQTVALGLTADGDVLALWRAEESTLQASRVEDRQGVLVVAEQVDVGELGRPVAWAGSRAFWLDGAYLRRSDPFAGDAPVSVAWSPVLIAEADLSVDAGTGLTALSWYGREQGGQVQVYASDDSQPFQPGFLDRVAAFMGWNPWHVWEEVAGQALTAIIVGLVGAMAAAPLLFAGSLLLPRLRGVRARPGVAGAVLGLAVPPLLVLALVSWVPSASLGDGPLLGLVATLAVGTLAGVLAARRGDREAQVNVLVSSAVTVLVGLTLWSFAYYRVWAPFVGL